LKENNKLTDLIGFYSENSKIKNIIGSSLQYTWTLSSRTCTQHCDVCGFVHSGEENQRFRDWVIALFRRVSEVSSSHLSPEAGYN